MVHLRNTLQGLGVSHNRRQPDTGAILAWRPGQGVGAHLEDLPGGCTHKAHSLNPPARDVPTVEGACDALEGEGDLTVGDGGRSGGGAWGSQILD